MSDRESERTSIQKLFIDVLIDGQVDIVVLLPTAGEVAVNGVVPRLEDSVFVIFQRLQKLQKESISQCLKDNLSRSYTAKSHVAQGPNHTQVPIKNIIDFIFKLSLLFHSSNPLF